jgi:AmmeMemoRadiSam system protein B
MGSVAGKESYLRRAHHAGSWYTDDANALRRELQHNLEQASDVEHSHVRAVIVPHAGYSYSGPTAAYAFKAIQQELQQGGIQHILVLHPSHHVFLQGCAVSGAHELETPLGNLTVGLRQELLQVGCTTMKRLDDEHEHSGEMQYPYLKLILPRHSIISVTPCMVGALSTEQEIEWGQRLAPIIGRDDVLTVVSSDFCHWGRRFSYQPTSSSSSNDDSIPIHSYIEQLDRQGMDLIERQEPGAFAAYLKQTRNTICGRHAIAVWMRATSSDDDHLQVKFVHYEQSSQAKSLSDSSVSYAAAVAVKK